MEQTLSSMAMKETTFSTAVDTESTKPFKVVKVTTKSMLLLNSTILIQNYKPRLEQELKFTAQL
jgi:hypothetical protein